MRAILRRFVPLSLLLIAAGALADEKPAPAPAAKSEEPIKAAVPDLPPPDKKTESKSVVEPPSDEAEPEPVEKKSEKNTRIEYRYRPVTKWQKAERILTWIGAGATGLLAIGGVAALGARQYYADRWNDDSRCQGNGKTRWDNCSPDFNHAMDAENLAVDLLVAAGALGTTSLVLYLASRPERYEVRIHTRTAPAPGVSCGPGPGALGVACAGHF